MSIHFQRSPRTAISFYFSANKSPYDEMDQPMSKINVISLEMF